MAENMTTDYAALADEIAGWLRGQLERSGAERFVLGLSGGVDSATVCALCCRAVGAERVLGAIMPSQSNPTDAEHATLVAETFGVETVRVDLTPVTELLVAAIPRGGDDGNQESEHSGEWRPVDRQALALANVKPRLRMATLYFLANLRNGIVAGTGNKSEASIGYFTKYGDGGVDLLPIVDLYKHEVRELARQLGVPEPIIAKPPSAGLWQDQTDEGEIGMTYDELDATLIAIERGEAANGRADAHAKVLDLMRVSEHKRQPVPSFRWRESSIPVPD